MITTKDIWTGEGYDYRASPTKKQIAAELEPFWTEPNPAEVEHLEYLLQEQERLK